MNIQQPNIYSTSIKLENNMSSLENSYFSSLPIEVVKKIFSEIKDSFLRSQHSLALTSKAFLALSLEAYSNEIYSYKVTNMFWTGNLSSSTLRHILQKIVDDKAIENLNNLILFKNRNEEYTMELFNKYLHNPIKTIKFEAYDNELITINQYIYFLLFPPGGGAWYQGEQRNLIIKKLLNKFNINPFEKNFFPVNKSDVLPDEDGSLFSKILVYGKQDRMGLIESCLKDSKFKNSIYYLKNVLENFRSDFKLIMLNKLLDYPLDPSEKIIDLLKKAKDEENLFELIIKHPKINLLSIKDNLPEFEEFVQQVKMSKPHLADLLRNEMELRENSMDVEASNN